MITVRGRIFGALLVAALLSSVLAAPAGAVEDETNAGFETVLRGTNDYRQASGRDRLIHDKALTAVAQAWAERMAADYAASRDIKQAFRHNTSLSSQVPAGWQGLAENIAANMGKPTPYVRLMDQWKTSAGHNANMLNANWTHIGVGTYQDNLGWTWGVQVFGDYGDPAAIPNPVHAVVDLDNLSYSGTADCVVLVSQPANSEYFRQCGSRPGNVYTFSDVPAGSYAFRVLASGGAVLYDGAAAGGGATTVARADTVALASKVRFEGAGRYDTAVAISQGTFPATIDTVFVVTGENFPDALAAGPAAAKLGGPVLLVQRNSVPASVVAELRRLAPRKIVALGGPSVISDGALSQLNALASSGASRIYGASRYATAAQIATTYFSAGSTPTVFLATGLNYPDALSGGPAGGMLGAPLLLSTTTTVPAETLSAIKSLGATKVVLLGGTGVLSSSIESQIKNAAGSVTVTRYSGASRYETSANIVASYFDPAKTTTAYVTVGNNFPDALAGSASAAASGAPILLSTKSCMPSATYRALQNLGVTKIVLLGGAGVIDASAPTTECR